MEERGAFALLLRRYRQAAGLTQEALAERAHLSSRTVSDLERGLNLRPRKDSLALLAQALGLAGAEQARFEDAARTALSTAGPGGEQPRKGTGLVHPTNLPRPLTSFIGRAQEQATVIDLLQEAPLVTLTGAGGCGKTRLSLEVARSQVAAYPDGVWLVGLAHLADPSLVPYTVAATLGVHEQPGSPLPVTLIAFLQPRRLMLVLDNCEHLVLACAELATSLLQACPQLQILATSREVLGITGERVWRVPSLSLPDPHAPSPHVLDAEAVRLFVERARAVRPTFALTEQNVETAVQVCRRLDGIPLALELAAARLSVLPLEVLAARLDDRFRLLTGGSRTALPRQQTLRATLDWSWGLLSGAERVLLRRLSVFAGGWTLEAAEMVCTGDGIETWAVLDLLGSLVNKSLVAREEAENSAGRFGLLETVRQYALSHLEASGEAPRVRERHLDWCLALAEQSAPALVDLDNLRAALRWAHKTRQAVRGMRLAEALVQFWHWHSVGRGWLEEFLALSSDDHLAAPEFGEKSMTNEAKLRAWALEKASWLAMYQTDTAETTVLAHQSLALYREVGDQAGIAAAGRILGIVARDEGDFGRAMTLFEESAALWRALGDKSSLSDITLQLAIAMLQQGHVERAATLAQESLTLFGENGDPLGSVGLLLLRGMVAHEQGELERARTELERSLAMLQDIRHKRGYSVALHLLSHVVREQGNPRRAVALGEESLVLARDLAYGGVTGWALLALGLALSAQGDLERAEVTLAECAALLSAARQKWYLARSLAGLATVARAQGRVQRAARLNGATAALLVCMNASLPRSEHAAYDRTVAATRAALGDAAFAAAWDEGQTLPPEAVVATALNDLHHS